MAQRATSLGPKPSLFLFWLYFVFGGFKGQVRWPKGPPHLALNPPYLLFIFFLFFVLPFLSLLCNTQKKPCYPPRKGHFLFIFECLPLFLLTFFWPPPFQCFFLVSLFFLSFFPFLPVFLFLLSFASLFLSLSFLSFFFAFV